MGNNSWANSNSGSRGGGGSSTMLVLLSLCGCCCVFVVAVCAFVLLNKDLRAKLGLDKLFGKKGGGGGDVSQKTCPDFETWSSKDNACVCVKKEGIVRKNGTCICDNNGKWEWTGDANKPCKYLGEGGPQASIRNNTAPATGQCPAGFFMKEGACKSTCIQGFTYGFNEKTQRMGCVKDS